MNDDPIANIASSYLEKRQMFDNEAYIQVDGQQAKLLYQRLQHLYSHYDPTAQELGPIADLLFQLRDIQPDSENSEHKYELLPEESIGLPNVLKFTSGRARDFLDAFATMIVDQILSMPKVFEALLLSIPREWVYREAEWGSGGPNTVEFVWAWLWETLFWEPETEQPSEPQS